MVYHGTLKEHSQDILNRGVLIESCKRPTDFGRGFYVTFDKKQAERFARKRASSSLLSNEETAVVAFELNLAKLLCLNGYVFHEDDIARWQKFIFNNRLDSNLYPNSYYSTEPHNNQMQPPRFDYVYGFVADGKMTQFSLLNLNIKSVIDEYIKTFDPIGDQLSFHTKEALSCLEIKEVRYNV